MFAREMMRESTAQPPSVAFRKFDWQKLVEEVRESRRRVSLIKDEAETLLLDAWRRLTPVSRFRAVVRMVLANLAWLSHVVDDDDEQVNVLLLQREADPSPLAPDVKAILRRPAHMRTDVERVQLHRAVGRLNCFRRYPEDVQRQLAENTYYVMYEPGRMIVRQGDEAQALYFVVSGQVCSLRKAAVFNLGESLERRRVVAAGNTSCLLIPRHWLMQHKQERWMEVRHVLQITIPTQQEVDAAFLQHRRWLHYRRRLVEQAVAGRRFPPPATSLHHVPYSIRIHSADMLH